MTSLDENHRKAQMDEMRSFDEQMPCVGIFWYGLKLGLGSWMVR